MWMKRRFNHRLILLMMLWLLAVENTFAQSAGRALHIILYSESGNVVTYRNLLERTNGYLLHLFTQPGELRVDTKKGDEINDERSESQRPLFHKNDQIIMLSFGMNDGTIDALKNSPNTSDSLTAAMAFLDRLVAFRDKFQGEDTEQVRNFLETQLPGYQAQGKYSLTFSYYAPVAALQQISHLIESEDYFDHIYMTIIANKLTYDEKRLSGIDRSNLVSKSPLIYYSISSVNEEFKNNFRKEDLVLISVGWQGGQYPIIIHTYEISPRHKPDLEIYSSDILMKSAGSDRLALAGLKVLLSKKPNYFNVSGGELIVNEVGKPLHSIQFGGNDFEIRDDTLEFKNMIFQPHENETWDKRAQIQIKFNVNYKYALQNGLPITASIATSRPVKVSKARSVSSSTKGLFLVLFLLPLSVVVYIVRYRPKIAFEFGQKHERLAGVSAAEDLIYGLRWDNRGQHLFDINVVNRSSLIHFLPGRAVVNIVLKSTSKKLQDTTRVALEDAVGNPKKFHSDDIELRNLRPGKTDGINLVFDFSNQPMPAPGEESDYEFVFEANLDYGFFKPRFHDLKTFVVRVLPPLEKCWIGFDPGTAGSCVAFGTDQDQIYQVHLGESTVDPSSPGCCLASQDQNQNSIMPSWVWIPENLLDQVDKLSVSQKQEHIMYGSEAQIQTKGRLKKGFAFHSAKKLLGTDIVMSSSTGTSISGKTIVSLLAERMLLKTRAVLEKGVRQDSQQRGIPSQKFEGKNAVVAVPIAFSPGQINEMNACFARLNLNEIRTIYEAEAAALYYLFIHKLKANEPPLHKTGGVMMVVDFGGATLNISILRYIPGQGAAKDSIQILSRVGYAIGGETINRIIASLAWEKFKTAMGENFSTGIDPFLIDSAVNNDLLKRDKGETEWYHFAVDFWDKVEGDKVANWGSGKNGYDNTRKLPDLPINFREFYAKTPLPHPRAGNAQEPEQEQEREQEAMQISLSLEEVTKSPGYQRLLKLIKEATALSLELWEDNTSAPAGVPVFFKRVLGFFSRKPSKTIDVLLFSGRAIHFPGIVETIKSALKDQPSMVDVLLDVHESKIAVAAGAVYYGIQRDNLELSQERTTCNFGFTVKKQRADEFVFYNILPIHSRFENGVAKSAARKEKINVRYNTGSLEFFQVFSKPEEADKWFTTKDGQYRCRPIATMEVPEHAKQITNLNMSIDKNNNFKTVFDFDGSRKVELKVDKIKWSEIQNKDDSFAEWLPVWELARNQEIKASE
ncbi:MAG: hypothetical protein ILNGONEN_01264 [Syntrophorhabdaceae bacterium]|nr:hypothetical protein [Syntrophorhabdaceae bacterium]